MNTDSVIAAVVLATVASAPWSFRVVPQARVGIVERLGRYHRTLDPGLAVMVPLVDKVQTLVDMREQVVSFPPQPVITQDNRVVSVGVTVFYRVTEPKAATYEVFDVRRGIEQLTVTTLRNVIGAMDLDLALSGRRDLARTVHNAVDNAVNPSGARATRLWGVQITRLELTTIDVVAGPLEPNNSL